MSSGYVGVETRDDRFRLLAHRSHLAHPGYTLFEDRACYSCAAGTPEWDEIVAACYCGDQPNCEQVDPRAVVVEPPSPEGDGYAPYGDYDDYGYAPYGDYGDYGYAPYGDYDDYGYAPSPEGDYYDYYDYYYYGDDYGDYDDSGKTCINGKCYSCPNGDGILFNNNTCTCPDGSKCEETADDGGHGDGYDYYDYYGGL